MKLCLALFCTASALAAATPSAQTDTPVKITAAERVPWTNLAELERYAANGHLKACAQLGEQLARGDGVLPDTARALPLLERAARGGIGSAAFRLGMIYDDGQGVPPDRRRALDYFRAAAAAGEAEGFFNVGAAYVGAHGVKRDYAEGLAWLILAAQRGAGGDTVTTVRARIQKLRHPEWITAAEARAPAIARELAAAPPASFLPALAEVSASAAPKPETIAPPVLPKITTPPALDLPVLSPPQITPIAP
jgi:hypothetical protein